MRPLIDVGRRAASTRSTHRQQSPSIRSAGVKKTGRAAGDAAGLARYQVPSRVQSWAGSLSFGVIVATVGCKQMAAE